MPTGEIKILILLIPLLPLLGFATLGLAGRRLGHRSIASVAISTVALSFVLSLIIILSVGVNDELIRVIFLKWTTGAGISVPLGFQIDSLSLAMIVAVTFISFLTNIWTASYMRDDPSASRYFAWLNLLTASMLLLVLAENYLLFFLGWEAVAICTWMLIGFRFHRKKSIDGARKFFTIGIVGDTSFLLGIILLAISPLAIESNGISRSLGFDFIAENIHALPLNASQSAELTYLATAASIFLLIGIVARSGLLPLSIWPADSTQGPAATDVMVQSIATMASGVYFIARAHTLFMLSPQLLTVLAILGGLTAVYAATVAMVKNDIRRILAYSSISQYGLMFVGLGVGAFSAAIFHFLMHAIYKSSLILAAGSVISGTNIERDIRKLGGLRQWMPSTAHLFLIATAVLAGFPLLSGFLSSNAILHDSLFLYAISGWNRFAGVLGYIAVFFTVIYSWRLYYRIFEGEYKGASDLQPMEASRLMNIAPWVLVIMSLFAGFIGLPISSINGIFYYLENVFSDSIISAREFSGLSPGYSLAWIVYGGIFIFALRIVRSIYLLQNQDTQKIKVRSASVYRVFWDEYGLEKFFRAVFVKPGTWFTGLLWRAFDEAFIDRGVVEGAGRTVEKMSFITALFQNGYVRTYAAYFLLGIILLVWLASL